MKHIKLFEQFVNESKKNESSVNEDLGIIDIAIGTAAGIAGLWVLAKGLPVVGAVLGDAAEILGNKVEKLAKEAAKKKRKEFIGEIIKKFDNDTQLKQMYNELPEYSPKTEKARKKQLTVIGNYIKSKLTPEESQYFTDISLMLRTGDLR